MLMDEIGPSGQDRLGRAKVAVVGAGGLGFPILSYLAAAGVGHLTVIDSDVVSVTNLNRQLFFSDLDVGESKALKAARALSSLNPDVSVAVRPVKISRGSVSQVLAGADVVVDAVDNISSRRVLSRWASLTGTPVFFGAVEGWKATLSFFNPVDPDSPCFECIYGGRGPSSNQAVAILGSTAGVAGSMQASRVLRFILGIYVPVDKLTIVDLKSESIRTLDTAVREGCSCIDRRTCVELCDA